MKTTPASKPSKKIPASSTALRGKMVRILTPQERNADIKAFGSEVTKTKESAIAFLKRAGIVDESGQLAEPFCHAQ